MESSIPTGILILIIVLMLGSSVAVYFAFRFIRKNQTYSGDPSKKEVASGYIESIRETGLFVNNRPQVEFEITLFPPHDAARLITMKQVVGFIELPLYQPGKYVMLSYEAGTYTSVHIDSAKPYAVTGAPFDPQSISDLTRQLTPSLAGQTMGHVISITETGSNLDDVPVYRILARFTPVGSAETEAETLRVCRPWLYDRLRSGEPVKILYNLANPSVFSVIE
ncbi:MAG TPA: hypothetical protein VN538_12740 [Clostridia bacterium]|nr:hypothetical protein [Clostridia bacterium]